MEKKEGRLSKLKLLKANHLSQKYALEDAISKNFPREIADTQARLTGYGEDIATVKAQTRPNEDGFSPMTLAGTTYAEKTEAGAALLTLCQNMLSPEPTQVGSYRGLTLELSFESFAKEYRLTMIGQLRHTVTLGTDIFGNRYSGIPTMRRAMREYGLPEPKFENRRHEFVVTLYNTPLKSTESEKSAEMIVSEAKTLLEFCRIPRTRREIADFYGIKTVFYVMKHYVEPLLESNQLALTMPDKPSSRNQRYYTVSEQ